jgi:hypothetical protein
MVLIYILGLENGKYYIGKTKNLEIRILEHINSSGSEWTKLYNPIKIIEYHDNCDDFDEDKYTIMMMNKYGIDNVRGGSYCTIILSESEKSNINKMIRGSNNLCYICSSSNHFAKNCHKSNRGSQLESEILSIIANSRSQGETKINKQKKIKMKVAPKCSRCGNSGHYITKCYAKHNVDGEPIIDNVCLRCGYSGHIIESCYAKRHISGKYLG